MGGALGRRACRPDRTGRERRRPHRVAVSQVSSGTFGGEDLGDLYITTAHEDFGPQDLAREPLAGGLFRCRPGVRGLLPVPFAG